MHTSKKVQEHLALQIRSGAHCNPTDKTRQRTSSFVQLLKTPKSTQVVPMTEPNKIPELVETSLAYILATVAAWLAFLLGWLICAVASR